MQHVDRAREPVEIIAPVLRLETRPSELADADEGKAGLAHAARVFGPQIFRPMFRIIADPEPLLRQRGLLSENGAYRIRAEDHSFMTSTRAMTQALQFMAYDGSKEAAYRRCFGCGK